MTDADLDLTFDGRRYSAVAISHPAIRDLKGLHRVLDGELDVERFKSDKTTGLTTYRVKWRHSVNMYPYGSTLRKTTETSEDTKEFSHYCFVGVLPGQASEVPTFIFAAPHIRVVGFFSKSVGSNVDNPRPVYLTPRLEALFTDLGSTSTLYRATQITLRLPNNDSLDKVSLTGKSPLISSLHKTLEPATEPYGVRLEIPRDGRPLRFHAERFGNFWWHQATDEAFPVAANVIASLVEHNYTATTHDLPHLRLIPPDGSRRTSKRR